MIILCVVEVVIVLLLIFLRKRILIAIALIKEASRSGRCHPGPVSPVAEGVAEVRRVLTGVSPAGPSGTS